MHHAGDNVCGKQQDITRWLTAVYSPALYYSFSIITSTQHNSLAAQLRNCSSWEDCWICYWVNELRFYIPLDKNRSLQRCRSFQRSSSQPISWRSIEETKPNPTKANRTTLEFKTAHRLPKGLKNAVFCPWWPWPSNSSEQGTKDVFCVNLAQICSAVPEIFHTQTNKPQTDCIKKQNLLQFAACGKNSLS